MKEEKNDCYKCVHRREVPGSAHSRCAFLEEAPAMEIMAMAVQGYKPTITDEAGTEIISIKEHGFRSGWAYWPINFDPCWITCRLPMVEKEVSHV